MENFATMSLEELRAYAAVQAEEAAKAKAALEAEKAKHVRSLKLKVGEKGGVSVYGLQRVPVTLYANQWERLLAFGGEILSFIGENQGSLSYKE